MENYIKKCNGEFWNLKNDNYIFLYLGYHLEKAGYLDRFKVFLNLDFVSKKIQSVGPRDMTRDLEKYKHYISVTVISFFYFLLLCNTSVLVIFHSLLVIILFCETSLSVFNFRLFVDCSFSQ